MNIQMNYFRKHLGSTKMFKICQIIGFKSAIQYLNRKQSEILKISWPNHWTIYMLATFNTNLQK
jgi:hypothetical protein